MKNPKDSQKKTGFFKFEVRKLHFWKYKKFFIFRAASYFVKHKNDFFFFNFFFLGGEGVCFLKL